MLSNRSLLGMLSHERRKIMYPSAENVESWLKTDAISPLQCVPSEIAANYKQIDYRCAEASSVVLGRLRASRRRPVEAQPTVGGRTSRRAYRTD